MHDNTRGMLTRTFWPEHIDDDILSPTFCPRHFVPDILTTTFWPRHFVRDILSVTFCPMTFCPHNILSATFCPWHFVRRHFVLEPLICFRCPRTINEKELHEKESGNAAVLAREKFSRESEDTGVSVEQALKNSQNQSLNNSSIREVKERTCVTGHRKRLSKNITKENYTQLLSLFNNLWACSRIKIIYFVLVYSVVSRDQIKITVVYRWRLRKNSTHDVAWQPRSTTGGATIGSYENTVGDVSSGSCKNSTHCVAIERVILCWVPIRVLNSGATPGQVDGNYMSPNFWMLSGSRIVYLVFVSVCGRSY